MPKAAAVRQSRKPRPRCAASALPGGLLVVVAGEDGRGKEMLVAIARRRFGADAGLAFPPRVSTRGQAAEVGDEPVSRRAFREMAEAGAFLGHWEAGGHAYGLGTDALVALQRGMTVVVVAGREAVARFSAVWPDVRVVEVRAGPDTVVGGKRGGRDVLSVSHQGDMATAVRRFHEILAAMRLERLTEAAPARPVGGRRLDRLIAPPPLRQAPSKACLRTPPHRA